MNKKNFGKYTLIKYCFYAVWLFPAIICIIVIEKYGLKEFGISIDIKSPTDILTFYSGIGATMAGILFAVITLVLTLNGQVKFAAFKANGWLKVFIDFCFFNSMMFILCSFCGIVGLYGVFPLKYSTYLFFSGLWGLPLIGFITRNLLMDTTNINSAVEGNLEQISLQLKCIIYAISAKETTDEKLDTEKTSSTPKPKRCVHGKR